MPIKTRKYYLNNKNTTRKKQKGSGNYNTITRNYYSSNISDYKFMDTILIPKGSYLLFCSKNNRPIEEGELPPQKYLWAQLYPPDYEPTPKDSWFCEYKNKNTMKKNTYYVYKLKHTIKMLFYLNREFSMVEVNDWDMNFTKNLIDVDKSLYNKLKHQKQQQDYIEMAIMYDLLNIDGIFRGWGDTEVILFGPFEDKLEFVKMYGGEEASKVWKNNNRYFKPSKQLLYQIKNALPNLSYYNKLQPYIKNHISINIPFENIPSNTTKNKSISIPSDNMFNQYIKSIWNNIFST